jgi:uncharacterized protein
MISRDVKKYLLVTAGTVSLAIGILFMFIPVLPTTPFLILALFFYARSSKKLYEWLINNKLFGIYIRDYVLYGAIKKRAKISTFVILWFSSLVSFILIHGTYARILLVVICVTLSICLASVKTLKPEHKDERTDQ